MSKTLLFIAFLLIKSIYIPLNRRKSKYYWRLSIDDKIPFIPIFIIPYLGYFIWILMTVVLLWNTKYIYDFFIAYIASYILGGAFWYFFPNGVRRPIIKEKDTFSKITLFIYSIDEDTNGFPSAHIFGTLICSYFMLLVLPQYLLPILIISFVISVSTLFTKQHNVIDLIGGFIVFIMSVIIASIAL